MTREINKLILSRIKQLLEHRDTYRVDLHFEQIINDRDRHRCI